MTVNTELSRAEFAWTGVESAFAAGFPADKAGDVRVLYRTPAGVISTLVNGVNYSVTLATGSKLVTIVPLSLPAAPGIVVVRRSTPALVTDTLQDGEGFSLEIIQRLHDIAAMRSAEDRDTLARAITLEEGAALGEGDFDLGGSGIANLKPGTSSTHAATVGQIQDLVVASGNVPAPVSGDTNRLLVATGPDAFAWLELALAMMPDGLLSADAAGRAKMAAGFLLASHVTTNPTELAALRTLLSVALAGPGDVVLSWTRTAPAGTMKANGAAVARSTYGALDAAIYCGDTDNPTASWGFRCTDPLNPTTSRSTTGTHIVLPDARGEFLRGWDDGRGVDSGRSFWAAQADALKAHTHGVTDPGHSHGNVGGTNAIGTGQFAAGQSGNAFVLNGNVNASTGISIQSTGGSETRPRNLSPLICIRF